MQWPPHISPHVPVFYPLSRPRVNGHVCTCTTATKLMKLMNTCNHFSGISIHKICSVGIFVRNRNMIPLMKKQNYSLFHWSREFMLADWIKLPPFIMYHHSIGVWSLSGVPDFFDRNKILSGYDLSHYQVPHCIRVFFYFVWFVFIHHNFQFYFKLCTYCNILDINLS